MLLSFSDCDPSPPPPHPLQRNILCCSPLYTYLLKHLESIQLIWQTMVSETLKISFQFHFFNSSPSNRGPLPLNCSGSWLKRLSLPWRSETQSLLLSQGVRGPEFWLQLKSFKVKHSPSHSDRERGNGFLQEGGKLEAFSWENLLPNQNKIAAMQVISAILVLNLYAVWYRACHMSDFICSCRKTIISPYFLDLFSFEVMKSFTLLFINFFLISELAKSLIDMLSVIKCIISS